MHWGVVVFVCMLSSAWAKITCSAGWLGKTCPDHAPVCCFFPSGEPSGCCRMGTTCDAVHTSCLIESTGETSDVVPIVHLHDLQTRVLVPENAAIALCAALQAAFLVCMWRKRQRRARRGNGTGEEEGHALLPAHLIPEPEDSDEEDEAFPADTDPEPQPSTPPPEGAEVGGEARISPSAGEAEEAAPGAPIPSPESAVDDLTCKVCFDSKVDCVLLNCGHACVCHACALHLRHCPFCQSRIVKRKKVYAC
eukprot:Hpha_TRINITY_DN24200_c0_g1::TRINITY_DN24200_c0_g1_i1::g.36118::m.36118